jgi:hypothetical protein
MKKALTEEQSASRAAMRKEIIRHRLERWHAILKEHIISSFEDEKRYLEEQLKKNPNEDDYGALVALDDDLLQLYNVFCVVLWSCVEPYLNQLGRLLDAEWKDCSNWDMIKDCYKDRGIDLRNLPRFLEMNIVRLINNCVKHNNSFVTKHLHAADSRRFKIEDTGKRQRVTLTQAEIESYFGYASEFLWSLVDACAVKAAAKLIAINE